MTARWYPLPAEISRETLIVIFGAIAAAIILQQLPGLKAWIAERLPTATPPS